jgi:hypothetical protein
MDKKMVKAFHTLAKKFLLWIFQDYEKVIDKHIKNGTIPEFGLVVNGETYTQKELSFNGTADAIDLVQKILSEWSKEDLKILTSFHIPSQLNLLSRTLRTQQNNVNALFHILYKTDHDIDFDDFGLMTKFVPMLRDFFFVNNTLINMQSISGLWISIANEMSRIKKETNQVP